MILFNDVAYRIYNKETGLYSSGGMKPMFGKKGKVWKSKAAFHAHLNYVSQPLETYKDCVVVFACRSDNSSNSINMDIYLKSINMDIYLKSWMEERSKKELKIEDRRMSKIRSKYIGKKIVDVKDGILDTGYDDVYFLILDDGSEVEFKLER